MDHLFSYPDIYDQKLAVFQGAVGRGVCTSEKANRLTTNLLKPETKLPTEILPTADCIYSSQLSEPTPQQLPRPRAIQKELEKMIHMKKPENG